MLTIEYLIGWTEVSQLTDSVEATGTTMPAAAAMHSTMRSLRRFLHPGTYPVLSDLWFVLLKNPKAPYCCCLKADWGPTESWTLQSVLDVFPHLKPSLQLSPWLLPCCVWMSYPRVSGISFWGVVVLNSLFCTWPSTVYLVPSAWFCFLFCFSEKGAALLFLSLSHFKSILT